MNRLTKWIVRRKVRQEIERAVVRLLQRPLNRRERTMLKALFGNWQTTLVGMVAAAVQLHAGGLTWASAFQAALFAALGIVAKDSNATGGNKNLDAL